MHQWTRLPRVDEGENLSDHRVVRELDVDPRQPVAKHPPILEEALIGSPHAVDIVAGEAAPAHADHVQAMEHSALTNREAERNDVSCRGAHAGNHGAFADADELVNRGHTAEHDAILERHMAAKYSVVGEDDVVAELAVMPNMRAHHEEAAVADRRHAAAFLGTAIHGDVLADVAARANDKLRRPAAVFDRLWRCAERGEGVDRAVRPNGCMAGHVHMGEEPAAFADHDMRADHAIGPNGRARCNLRALVDAGRGIDRGHRSIQRRPWRRPRPRPPPVRPPWPRRGTTTCSFSWPSCSCDIRSYRRALRACGTWPCRW